MQVAHAQQVATSDQLEQGSLIHLENLIVPINQHVKFDKLLDF